MYLDRSCEYKAFANIEHGDNLLSIAASVTILYTITEYRVVCSYSAVEDATLKSFQIVLIYSRLQLLIHRVLPKVSDKLNYEAMECIPMPL